MKSGGVKKSWESPRLISRRDVLGALASLPWAVAAGCGPSPPPTPGGQILGAARDRGHRIRAGTPPVPTDDAWRDVDVLIVGAGVAGLAAARRLTQAGCDDFVLCELEPRGGGTSTSGRSDVTAFPWGAHYLPLPMASNGRLVELLEEMHIVTGRDEDGEPQVDDGAICRAPQERLFADGRWHADLDPVDLGDAADRAEAAAFAAEVDRWVEWRDARGRRAFTLPIAACSDDPAVRRLDQITMAQWLDEHGWRSARLRWLVDYACRDDYGLTIDQTSAWAGLFYSASRKRRGGGASQPLLTWPAGNGRLVEYLADRAGDRLRLDSLVHLVRPGGGRAGGGASDSAPAAGSERSEVVVENFATGAVEGWRARRVLVASPQFVASRVVAGYAEARGADLAKFAYGSWLVANLHLRGRPAEGETAAAWDNVLYEGPSLGYVAATHQEGSDYGPTVWTYYLPFCGESPGQERRRLDELSWADAAERVLADLERAHPDLRNWVEHLDVMVWGHAMIRPTPGFVTGEARRRVAEPWRGVHFAHTDLSGVALFEEAFYHGERGANEILAALG